MTKSFKLSVLILFVSMYSMIAQEVEKLSETTSVTIEISGVKSDAGQLFIGMYTDEANWLQEAPHGTTSLITNGKASVTLTDIPAGEYAISIYHDENDNGELDSNWLGIPNEPFACSNGAKGRFGPPKWVDAVFTVKGTAVTQNIIF